MLLFFTTFTGMLYFLSKTFNLVTVYYTLMCLKFYDLYFVFKIGILCCCFYHVYWNALL